MADLDQHPRVELVSQPTAIEHLKALSDQLGIALYVKRDDTAGTTFGGNKSRQLNVGCAQLSS